MEWSLDTDRVEIHRLARSQNERDILRLTEKMAELGDPTKLTTADLSGYSPDQICNAMLLVVSHFQGGDEFYEKLSPIEAVMVRYQISLVIAMSNEYAASRSHKNEADEELADSES